uniref:Transcription factor CBF/NF-Y/archaeal histone domain-containing protein n=1 Tax=Globisporangium ultimum (strain ATCC 200006 / CBS 805.95 / DAOM BR144) TaxID=431595 RepID=K3X5Z3_GLOUD
MAPGLPKVVIEKLLRDVILEEIAIQKETLEWVNECATEFLLVVGAKANELAEAAAKKENYRISAEHVEQTLEMLGKRKYVDEIREQHGAKASQPQKKRQRGGSRKQDAATHDELLAEQNALFKKASMKATKEGW